MHTVLFLQLQIRDRLSAGILICIWFPDAHSDDAFKNSIAGTELRESSATMVFCTYLKQAPAVEIHQNIPISGEIGEDDRGC